MYEDLVFYIARNKNGLLCMHKELPHRYNDIWVSDGYFIEMPCSLYDNLIFYDEPVRIILHPQPEPPENELVKSVEQPTE